MMSLAEPTVKPAAERQTAGRTTVRNVLAIVAFALTCHIPGYVPADASAEQIKVNQAELPRFHCVHSYFYRGAAPTFPGLDELKKLGVKTVVDLRRSPSRIDEERKYCSLIGLNYVSLPMGNFVPPAQKRQQFLSIIGDAEKNPEHGPVFLHCSHGSDRTGFLTALWRVQHDHWSILQAAAEMVEYGFLVHRFDPHDHPAE